VNCFTDKKYHDHVALAEIRERTCLTCVECIVLNKIWKDALV